jgi:hypothetical protein
MTDKKTQTQAVPRSCAVCVWDFLFVIAPAAGRRPGSFDHSALLLAWSSFATFASSARDQQAGRTAPGLSSRGTFLSRSRGPAYRQHEAAAPLIRAVAGMVVYRQRDILQLGSVSDAPRFSR